VKIHHPIHFTYGNANRGEFLVAAQCRESCLNAAVTQIARAKRPCTDARRRAPPSICAFYHIIGVYAEHLPSIHLG
jgi:hypothetical protein